MVRAIVAGILAVVGCAAAGASGTSQADAADVLTFVGYPDCILLQNEHTRVVVGPIGGRVLEYSWQGQNGLYLEEEATGRPYSPAQHPSMSAGRFDIGPEKIIPPRPTLWEGEWQAEITGERTARLTSAADDATGTQLVRDFELAAHSSRLACTQTIINISDAPTEWCHWSRTFARGNGICLIPLTASSRFPNAYVMYEGGDRINLRPQDPSIRKRGGFLEILDVPAHPKLGMDSYAGWFAYLMRNDLMFVKKFPVDRNRVYNEVAGLTISIWYPPTDMVELEPIGPRERLAPGESAAFTEVWYMLPYKFPEEDQLVDLAEVQRLVAQETSP